jgi:three-Cys-motif partner protein
MGNQDFHEKPYDDGTLAKLRIFELYAQEWIPVFVSKPNPHFKAVHIFDFFCGPGTDSQGVNGSPLRILAQLRDYHAKGVAGWSKVGIFVHLFDADQVKIDKLQSFLQLPEWQIPGVQVDCRSLAFQDALVEHQSLLLDANVAKLLLIDQFGVQEVSAQVFAQLISFPIADFIFFLTSSTLNRFRNDPAIEQKIGPLEDSYDVHREAVNYYRKLIPAHETVFLGSFSIKKVRNIYGLIFGSHHPLGIDKFLRVAWVEDGIAGEANFDIERVNIRPEEGILPLDIMRPNKVRQFEQDLEAELRRGAMPSEADVVRFCLEAGMTCSHSAPVLQKLKAEGIIALDFRVPDGGRIKDPRPIRFIHR